VTDPSLNFLKATVAAAQGRAQGLPTADVESVRVLIAAGEFGIALETLCTQIYEFDVELNIGDRERLEELGRKLGVAVPYLLGDPWAQPPEAGTT
jgi:hypothetical protein